MNINDVIALHDAGKLKSTGKVRPTMALNMNGAHQPYRPTGPTDVLTMIYHAKLMGPDAKPEPKPKPVKVEPIPAPAAQPKKVLAPGAAPMGGHLSAEAIRDMEAARERGCAKRVLKMHHVGGRSFIVDTRTGEVVKEDFSSSGRFVGTKMSRIKRKSAEAGQKVYRAETLDGW